MILCKCKNNFTISVSTEGMTGDGLHSKTVQLRHDFLLSHYPEIQIEIF